MFRLDKHETNHQGKCSARGHLLCEYLSLRKMVKMYSRKVRLKAFMSRVTIKVKRQKSEEDIALKVMVRNSEKSWEFILSPSPSLSLSSLTQALKSTRTEAPQLPGLTYLHEELQGRTRSLRCLQRVRLDFVLC